MRSPLLLTSAAGVAAAVAASLLAWTPASAVEVYNPVCPPATAVQGIAIPATSALDLYDKNAGLSISAGALPDGVTLTGDATKRVPYQFEGTPTTAGSSTFTVKATFEDAPPKTIDCTMVVAASPAVSRVQGVDRYDQAVQLSKRSFTHAETVYLASGEKFPDALSAGSVAGVHGAPLLLTKVKSITTGTTNEIIRLAPSNVLIVGGPASIDDVIMRALSAALPDSVSVTRIWGADRFEVSRNLIADPDFGVPTSNWVYLASGGNFPDALAASPAAVAQNGPVLLVNGTETRPTAAETALLDGMGVTNVQIVGGTASVSQALQTALETPFVVTRASGADRFEAAVAINQQFTAADTVYLASGLVFPDALSAAPVAGEGADPIYLVQQNCVPAPVLQEIVRLKATKVVVLGGTATLGTAVDKLTAC